mgnify:CR=1 FL=1
MPRREYCAPMTTHPDPLTRDQIRELARPGAIHVEQISPSSVKITIGDRVEVYDLVPDAGPDTDTLRSPVGPYTYELVIDVLRRQAAVYESAVGLLWAMRDQISHQLAQTRLPPPDGEE